MTRRERLRDLTSTAGLYVRTWAPGDGVTRYRFYTSPANSYFGPDSPIATVLGVCAAEQWLYAYQAGYGTGVASQAPTDGRSQTGGRRACTLASLTP